MHINRSIRRLARMTGVEPPSMRSLEQRLEKRVLSIEGPEGLRRRFNRARVIPSPREVQLEKRFNRVGILDSAHRPGKTRPSSGTPGTAGTSSTSSSSTVTFANTPTTVNSLGLNIEYVLVIKCYFYLEFYCLPPF